MRKRPLGGIPIVAAANQRGQHLPADVALVLSTRSVKEPPAQLGRLALLFLLVDMGEGGVHVFARDALARELLGNAALTERALLPGLRPLIRKLCVV